MAPPSPSPAPPTKSSQRGPGRTKRQAATVATTTTTGTALRRPRPSQPPLSLRLVAAACAASAAQHQPQQPPRPSWPAVPVVDGLDAELEAFAALIALTPAERLLRRRLVAELSELIRSIYPAATIELFGSARSGIDSFRSDLDLTAGNLIKGPAAGTSKTATASIASRTRTTTTTKSTRAPADTCLRRRRGRQTSITFSYDDDAEYSSDDNWPGYSFGLGYHEDPDNGDDDEEDDYAEEEDVNYALVSPSFSPVASLRVIYHALVADAKFRWSAELLDRASVPIIMLQHRPTGQKIDLGAHHEPFEGSDPWHTTTMVAELVTTHGTAFTSVVGLIKEMLRAAGLDRTYTGGIGSFTVYAMVAFILQEKLLHRKKPSPSAVLLAFLDHFGSFGNLHQYATLSIVVGGRTQRVSFEKSFRVDSCVSKFRAAGATLRQTPSLARIYAAGPLRSERQRSIDRAKEHLNA